ncbi:MAG: quinone-dependent dihydroorotate dehydrogenase [Alphaproteobacteria bacterium]
MNLYPLARPFLMKMDAEDAHRLTIKLLKAGLGPRQRVGHASLAVKLWGLDFPNPLGLAAGFDKEAEVVGPLFNMGFGFVEAGTVTPKPQEGNPRPRVFRDEGNRSVINKMGFPGKGLDVFAANAEKYLQKKRKGVFGVNIGANKDTVSRIDDYRQGITRLAPLADYITINISSPNTAGLRDLQKRDELDLLLEAAVVTRDAGTKKPPLLLKVAPDLDEAQRGAIAELVLKYKIDGLIVSNTTISRPPELKESLREQGGGLSGQLVRDLSTEVLHDFYSRLRGAVPIVGAGGVATAEDAYAKIRAGAALVQMYTGLIYEGPAAIPRILEGLALLLKRDGYADVSGAVGAAHATGKKPAKAVG